MIRLEVVGNVQVNRVGTKTKSSLGSIEKGLIGFRIAWIIKVILFNLQLNFFALHIFTIICSQVQHTLFIFSLSYGDKSTTKVQDLGQVKITIDN